MKIGKIEEIYKPVYSFSDDKISHVIRIITEMKKPVNGKALSAAVDMTRKRYPYFAVRAEIQGNAHVNVANDLSIVVKEGISSIALLSDESNYHVMALQYDHNTIVLDVAHSVTDASGIMPFYKTLMYYYVKYAMGDEVESEGINLADSPLFDDELGDPRNKIDFSKIESPLSPNAEVGDHFRIRELKPKNIGTKVVHLLRIDESEFMKFAKSSDGSPAVAIGVLFTKVFWKLSNTDKPIVVNIACNHRPALHNKHSYRTLSNILPVVYQARQKDWTIDRLCTSGRGAVMLQSEEQNLLFAEKMGLMFEEQIKKIPSVGVLHSVLRGRITESLDRCTINVSYPGRSETDVFVPYIEDLFALTDDLIEGGMTIEIMNHNGKFEVSIMQGFDDDCVLREFEGLLDEVHIPYEYLKKETMDLATALPELE